jgi:uncharacterized protein
MLSTYDLDRLYKRAEDLLEAGKHERAQRLYYKLAMQAHPESLNILGNYLYEKVGSNKDALKEVAFCIKESAKRGCLDAQHNLALLYYNGIGVRKNLNKSIQWFEIAALQGHLLSQLDLAEVYILKDNYNEALTWLYKIAESVSDDTIMKEIQKLIHKVELKIQ